MLDVGQYHEQAAGAVLLIASRTHRNFKRFVLVAPSQLRGGENVKERKTLAPHGDTGKQRISRLIERERELERERERARESERERERERERQRQKQRQR